MREHTTALDKASDLAKAPIMHLMWLFCQVWLVVWQCEICGTVCSLYYVCDTIWRYVTSTLSIRTSVFLPPLSLISFSHKMASHTHNHYILRRDAWWTVDVLVFLSELHNWKSIASTQWSKHHAILACTNLWQIWKLLIRSQLHTGLGLQAFPKLSK